MWRLYDEVAKKGIDFLLFFCASFFLPLIAFNEFICRARGEVTNRIVVPVANSITIIITRRFDTCNLQHNISWKKVLKQTPVSLTIIVNIILNWPSKLNRRDFREGQVFQRAEISHPVVLPKLYGRAISNFPFNAQFDILPKFSETTRNNF